MFFFSLFFSRFFFFDVQVLDCGDFWLKGEIDGEIEDVAWLLLEFLAESGNGYFPNWVFLFVMRSNVDWDDRML